ncbi:MAG: M48 family metallopeptidase [Cytophagales bacterium]|nr:M48 family metallopeptidase [Cytophagales bacterium]
MTESAILNLLLAIVVLDFLLERVLGYLNDKSSKASIPSELSGVYDEDQYQKSQEYQRVTGKFGNFTATFSFLLTLSALYFGWFGWLDQAIITSGTSDLFSTLIFFGIIFIGSDLLSTPFSIYSTFVIEERFGFNKTTVKTYLLDKIKGYVLAIIIGGLLISVLLVLIEMMGTNFWIYFWIVITVFVLFINVFYTSWILPLFNQLKPIEEGELKSSIEAFSKQVGFPLSNIFVMDGSKRSSKGNAFFSGLGKRKKVVLFDTLIANHTTEELTAVFAHEVGHYKKKHIILSTILSILQMGIMLFLLSRMIFTNEVSLAMGGETSTIHLNMLAFAILFSPLSRILGIFMNKLSRKNEYEADEYAVKNYDSTPLIEGLKKMSSDHLSNLTPHPAYVFVNYSHPPLLERVRAMKSVDQQE